MQIQGLHLLLLQWWCGQTLHLEMQKVRQRRQRCQLEKEATSGCPQQQRQQHLLQQVKKKLPLLLL